MLGRMDLRATTTAAASGSGVAPWIVLGVVLGIALVALAGLATALLLRPRRRPAPPPAPTGWLDDDLLAFRDTPPGFAGAPRRARHGWVSLAPAPPAPAAVTADRPWRLLAGLSGAVLALIGVAALVAGLSGGEAAAHRPAESAQPGVTAELTFRGLVLERRAVGVTATAPSLRLTTAGDDAHASVTLPTWNCLTDAAPADPAAADCAETPTEYADLAEPELEVAPDGDGLRVSGRFATYTRPNGGPPETTGRVYALTFTVAPDDAGGGDGADGEVRLGDDSAPAVNEPGVNVFRRHG
jgi:hypothetical protein